MKFSKKILAAVLAALMAISMMPFTVFAAPPGSSGTGTGTGGISIGGGSTVVGEEPYLTFTGTDSFSIKTYLSAKNWNGTLEYSTDANTWTTWNGTSQISSNNNVLYLRGKNNTQITGGEYDNCRWVITTQGTVACSGDIRTLLDYTDPESSEMGTKCFAYLFKNCTSLTAAPELPATILASSCYHQMFYGCTSLTTAPELPSTSLAEKCYSYMFYRCTSLTTAPELWATTLAPSCYSCMFFGCTSLTTAPELWATTLTNSCYSNMFYGCTSLTTAPALPATELADFCYTGMFQGCTSLTTPSELPATVLTKSCYKSMFQGCTGIKLSTTQTAEYSVPYRIPEEETGTEGTDSLTDMFTGTGGTFTGTPTINTTYYIPAPAPAELNNGASITVAETISENFYLDDDFYGETAYVSFTYNHNSDVSETADVSTDVMAMSSLDEATDGRKKFSITQAPAQATEPITINIYGSQADADAGTNAIDTIDYSVYAYCRDIIENYTGEKAEEMKELAETTLDYAAAAQTYFNYNTGDMATKDATGDFYNDVAGLDMSEVSAPVSAAPSCIKRVSVVVKSDLEINLLSNAPLTIEGAGIAATKGTENFAVSTYPNGDYYVLHIAGIEAANMNKTITVETNEGDLVMTANSIIKMLAASGDTNLSTLAKAMYLYGTAASAYFD